MSDLKRFDTVGVNYNIYIYTINPSFLTVLSFFGVLEFIYD